MALAASPPIATARRRAGTARRHHLADQCRQHRSRVLPADQVEALECLVEKVERVAAIGEGPLGLGGEQDIGEQSRRSAACNRGQERALGRFAMPHLGPAPQPCLESGRIRPAAERRAVAPRRLSVAILGYAASTMKQCEIGVLVR